MRLPAFAIAVLLVMLQWDCRSFAGPGRRRVYSFWALGATALGVSGAVIFLSSVSS